MKKPLLWFLTGTIGDALMAIALCNELAELNPGTTSVMFVRRDPKLVADMARLVPSVTVVPANFSLNTMLYIARSLWHPWQVMSAWHSVGLRKALRALYVCNPATSVVRFDIHAPATHRDKVAHYDEGKLVIDNFRVLAQVAGLITKPLGTPMSLPIATEPTSFPTQPYIVLHPFGSNDIKSLPVERCRSIVQALAAAYPQLSFVITGGGPDRALAEKIVESMPHARVAIGLPILEVAGLIEHAALYIGVDTGITHLAAMMGKHVLALEHPTMPRWYPTYNPNTTMLIAAEDPRAGVWGVTDTQVVEVARTVLA